MQNIVESIKILNLGKLLNVICWNYRFNYEPSSKHWKLHFCKLNQIELMVKPNWKWFCSVNQFWTPKAPFSSLRYREKANCKSTITASQIKSKRLKLHIKITNTFHISKIRETQITNRFHKSKSHILDMSSEHQYNNKAYPDSSVQKSNCYTKKN